MRPLSISKLSEIIEARSLCGLTENIKSVSIDSRTVQQDGVFFAIKGANFDGHDFISRAFENGALCAIAQKKVLCSDDKKILLVDDTVTALGRLAAFLRKESNYKVIAVTGSAGKTTVRSMLFHVLSGRFRCFTAPKSFNNNVGVPLTVFDAPDDCEYVLSELGSNHAGEIEYLSKIICPDIALITTVCPAHLAGLGSMGKIIEEKVSIAAGLKPGGKLFINGDKEELVNYCRDGKTGFTSFGTTEKCDVFAENIKLLGDKSTFQTEGVCVALPLAGRANVENAMAAWAICKFLGISAKEFAASIADIKPVDMRLEIIEFGPVTVINDCYNANPGSMENAIETLALAAGQKAKRAVFVFGLMGELGSQSKKLHEVLGRAVGRLSIPVLLTTSGDSAIAAQAAQECAGSDITVGIFKNVVELCDNLYKFIQPDDIILVKASRSEHFESVVEKLKELFVE